VKVLSVPHDHGPLPRSSCRTSIVRLPDVAPVRRGRTLWICASLTPARELLTGDSPRRSCFRTQNSDVIPRPVGSHTPDQRKSRVDAYFDERAEKILWADAQSGYPRRVNVVEPRECDSGTRSTNSEREFLACRSSLPNHPLSTIHRLGNIHSIVNLVNSRKRLRWIRSMQFSQYKNIIVIVFHELGRLAAKMPARGTNCPTRWSESRPSRRCGCEWGPGDDRRPDELEEITCTNDQYKGGSDDAGQDCSRHRTLQDGLSETSPVGRFGSFRSRDRASKARGEPGSSEKSRQAEACASFELNV
jgi:hypothetical protein